MSIYTHSATQFDPVMVEHAASGACSDVWLRRDIEQDTADNGPDGTPYEFWTADELHFIVPGTPSVAEIAAEFDALWDAHDGNDLSDREMAQDAVQRVADVEQAVAELGTLMVGGE